MSGKMGRPRKELDFEQIDKLVAMHCTGEEIAGFFDVDINTLTARIREIDSPSGGKYKTFSEYFSVKSGLGRITLRKLQWDAAKHGNVNMQVWLGKNYLNQTDKTQVDMGGASVIKVTLEDHD
jgi:hypothetical protein